MSAQRELIDLRLAGELARIVATNRTAGVSWDQLANTVTNTSGVQVTSETLRRWFAAKEPS